MKKLKLLVILFALTLILPFNVFADENDEVASEAETVEQESSEDEKDLRVKIYFFRGEGCPHCQEAEEWFESIQEEMGSFFELVDYETWYNEDNAKLMQDVAEMRGEKAEGVPYIVIGDKSWSGFSETYTEDIKNQIKDMFAKDVNDRYDVMEYLKIGGDPNSKKDKKSNDVLVLFLILIIVGGAGFGIYKARKASY